MISNETKERLYTYAWAYITTELAYEMDFDLRGSQVKILSIDDGFRAFFVSPNLLEGVTIEVKYAVNFDEIPISDNSSPDDLKVAGRAMAEELLNMFADCIAQVRDNEETDNGN